MRRYLLDAHGVPVRIDHEEDVDNKKQEAWLEIISDVGVKVICDEMVGDYRVITSFLATSGPHSLFDKETTPELWECRAYKQGKNNDQPVAEASFPELRYHSCMLQQRCAGNAYHAQRMQAAVVKRLNKFHEMGQTPCGWNWAAYT